MDPAAPQLVHPHAWLWEPLAEEPTFIVRAMFGARAVYLHGWLMLCFTAKAEPWRGVLLCTEHARHAALIADFPMLKPHPVLPKWLYLSEADDAFEAVAQRLVALARRRDPRLGVVPEVRKRVSRAPRKTLRERSG